MQRLPRNYLTTKLTSLSPPPIAFHPYVLQAKVERDDTDTTACLWTQDENLKPLSVWATRWKGINLATKSVSSLYH